MMRTLNLIGVLVLCLLVATNTWAGTSLVSNGSFEIGTLDQAQLDLYNTKGYVSLSSGSTAISGWTVGGDYDVDYIGEYWDASDGSHSLDMNGDNGAGSIYQAFSTVVGQTYQVVFDMAGNPDGYQHGVDPIKSLNVSAAGDSQDFDFDSTGTTRYEGEGLNGMGWQEKTWTFVANDVTTTLTFTSLETAEGDNGYGAALDNVRVFTMQTVPVPGAILLTGIGLTGLIGMRRKLRRY